jgi:glutamate---cysteine ligase / carboxylate-amine ligase
MSDPGPTGPTLVWAGDVTTRRVKELRDLLFDQIDAHPDGLTLDMREVTGIDRTGVALLIGANVRAHSLARTLTILDDGGIVSTALARAHVRDDFTIRRLGAGDSTGPGRSRHRAPITTTDCDEFGQSQEFTVGVEEEFMLVRPDTLALLPAASSLISEIDDPEHVKPEIRQCMVEIASDPHRVAADLYDDLAALRRRIALAAYKHDCRVAGGGTHPFSAAQDEVVTDSQRYHDVIVESGYPARWSVVFGTHVHVALSSADKAIQVTEALLEDLPILVALSSSSPIWNGVDTGLASTRLALWASVPRSGTPPRFDRYSDYLDCLSALRLSGAVADPSHVWWDVRTQARLGTLEVRILDGQPRLRDTVALAALVQALVHFHSRRWDEGVRAAPQRFLVTENRWAAIWHGMEASFAHPNGDVSHARADVDELLSRVSDDANALSGDWALHHLSDLADAGGPAARLRDTLSRTGDPVEVAREQVRSTNPDTDVAPPRREHPVQPNHSRLPQ